MSYYYSPSAHVKSVSPQLSPGSNSAASSNGSTFSPAPAAFLPPAPLVTDAQREALEYQFARLKNPHSTDVMLLAAETGLHEREVQAWFTRRLAEWRRDQGLAGAGGRIC
ncbi:homeodomain-only protein-like [Hetaerina americana]|uniref:homeodomain-only protein-like n=1 Tax=Hetaerina americana TaxID=62018 RepID=UPI003A7F1422